MKYIRTKDGKIIETNRLPIERFSIELVKIIDKQCGLPNQHIEEIEILKQADTIEELCDCIVYDCLPRPYQDAYHKHEIGNIESLKWNREPERFENIYGAIWTDKGLIYVAKMNEKGELELL